MSGQHYVGIDLGTVNSSLAYADDSGKVTISRDGQGRSLLPSTVIFSGREKYVGYEATEREPDFDAPDSVYYFKRLMGTDFVRVFDSVPYTPIELSALVISKIAKIYEGNTGMRIGKAVITVPGDYTDAEKDATIAAAKIAGIDQVSLINESVAAAISALTFSGIKSEQKVIVYDLGGGTLDVTVVKINNNQFTVLSDESSKDLGGKDWDLQLGTIIQKKILDSCGLTADDVESDSNFRKSVMAEAERKKILLESRVRAVGTIDLRGEKIRYTVSRQEFEESTAWLMMKSIEMVGYALRNAGLRMSDIDNIILVGGSTLMPQVKRSLEEAFPSQEIISHDPENDVAMGAAIYARSRFGPNPYINVTSVSTRTIGVKAGIDGVERVCNIIFRNTPLPIDKKVQFITKRDDQKVLDIRLYESMAKPNEPFIDETEGKLISKNEIPLTGKISRGKTKIIIRFIQDIDGRLSIVVQCNDQFTECRTSDMKEITPDDISNSKSKMGGII